MGFFCSETRTHIHWACGRVFRQGKCRNVRMEADLMVRRVSSWITLDTHTHTNTHTRSLQLNTQQRDREWDSPPHHTFPTCLITPIPPPCGPFHNPSCLTPNPHNHCPPYPPRRTPSSSREKRLTCIQHLSAKKKWIKERRRPVDSQWLPGAKITVSKC